MQEFIAKHQLGVSEKDPQASRRVAARLRALGYTCRTLTRDGKRAHYWTKQAGANYALLDEKLNRIAE